MWFSSAVPVDVNAKRKRAGRRLAAKKPRTVSERVAELKALKELLDDGTLAQEEFANLKARLLESD